MRVILVVALLTLNRSLPYWISFPIDFFTVPRAQGQATVNARWNPTDVVQSRHGNEDDLFTVGPVGRELGN
jgi:hypothetical protein